MDKKQLENQITIPYKLENKSEAYIKMKLAEKNRQKYLDNFIKEIEKQIDLAVEMGCNVIETELNVYNFKEPFHNYISFFDRKNAIIYNYVSIQELYKIIEYFKKMNYVIDTERNSNSTEKIKLNISFINIQN